MTALSGRTETPAWPPTVPAGWSGRAFDSVASTSVVARELAEDACVDRMVVLARQQTGGRGRISRSWASPPGNLYSSVILRPPVPAARAAELTFIAALAVHDALSAQSSRLTPTLKWPNDVLVNQRKIAGILLECDTVADGRLAWVCMGVGINVVSHPANTASMATDLTEALGAPGDLQAVLTAYLTGLDHWCGTWLADGFTAVRAAWLDRAHPPGTVVHVRTGETPFTGRFETIDEHGTLVVVLDDGTQRLVAAGDVMIGGPDAAGD